ncbi:MAG: hypothetical protein A3A28_03210 [Candidatus Sungbacteria bacterium RIFCSPLOWO2_01_FULL_47_32]|uniref:Acylphosphatase n=1 Tax=Candidatus Sungbacteria bacterium RIFCSPHIGHO2_01_FULL_47_32 TaxID=1802264 RepID=A0A1G2K2M5_9BACT|nr:MAG: Acylphosphatase [Parcubacteria group bacterium GW2011_GWA2_47_10]OGZ93635.1 MAG: hypothetical protein A2633_04750 [Candidatus Sungbacteria bacterium RIFCSPHIGHO2_01_FULL_47_32]OHA05476.1 MAG: hypothetical protein A3A28_03210 [Candidatus Sungbacteria bacterium RIFCSPLOWO2_01_FULL_47_32]
MERMFFRVIGLVQGVFFRESARTVAKSLGITGFVRNDADGSVVITAEGNGEALQKLEEWCKKGTEWSRVDRVESRKDTATGEFTGFEIR